MESDPITDDTTPEPPARDRSEPPSGQTFTVDPGAEDYIDESEYVTIPRAGSPLVRGLVVLGIGVLVIGSIAFFGWRWFRTQIDGAGTTGETVRVVVEPGATVSDVASTLEGAGVIENATMFRYWLTITGKDPVFLAGEYEMAVGGSFDEALDQLDQGPAPPEFDEVTIPEGLRAEQVYERIDEGSEAVTAAELAEAAASGDVEALYKPADGPPGLEGFMFPETYRFDREGQSAADMLQRMVDQFDLQAGEVGLAQAEERVGLTPYEVVTMASLIEKETAADSERAKIARVIYNRLEQGIPLGIDASLIYVVAPLRTLSGDEVDPDDPTFGLTQTELELDSPYNTRVNTGLPPTPIASPGRASLEAALTPEEGPWTYYVLQSCDGTHLFTDSSTEFERQKEASQAAGDPGRFGLLTTARTRVAAVMGRPIRHSLSPAIVGAAFDALGLDWTMVAFDVGEGGGADAVDAVAALGIEGCSVTMPLKQEVADALDRLDPPAEVLRAVNCIYRDEHGLVGTNTDGPGFCSSLEAAGVSVVGRSFGVIGAGGAARAVIAAITAAGAADVLVVNRSADRAAQAIELSPVARSGEPSELGSVDIVVNATSVGMGDGALPVDPDLLADGQVVADLVYQPVETPLLARARVLGLRTVDGVGMLVHQAALAVERWTGLDPPIETMTDAARSSLDASRAARNPTKG